MIRKLCPDCNSTTIIVPTPDTIKNGKGKSGYIEMHEICSACSSEIEYYPDLTANVDYQTYMQLLCASLQNQRVNVSQIDAGFFKDLNNVFKLAREQLKLLIDKREFVNE